MPKNLADFLAETESFLDIEETKKQLKSGYLKREDVEDIAPQTFWRDLLTETLLDPSQYLTGAAMGAGFAAKLGRPALATALEWADPLMGGSKAIGRVFTETAGKWPVGARMGGIVGRRVGERLSVSPEELIGTPPRGPMGLLEEGRRVFEARPSPLARPEVPTEAPIGARTLGEMFPLGMRRVPTGETQQLLTSGRQVFEMPPSSMAHGELSEDVVNLSNSFARQIRQPIDELVEAAETVVNRNSLVREAEKLLLPKNMESYSAVRNKQTGEIFLGSNRPFSTHGTLLERSEFPLVEGRVETGWIINGKFYSKQSEAARELRDVGVLKDKFGSIEKTRNLQRFSETPKEAKTHTARLAEQVRMNKEFLKQTTKGQPAESGTVVLDRPELRSLASTIWKSEGKSGVDKIKKMLETGEVTVGEIKHNLGNELTILASKEDDLGVGLDKAKKLFDRLMGTLEERPTKEQLGLIQTKHDFMKSAVEDPNFAFLAENEFEADQFLKKVGFRGLWSKLPADDLGVPGGFYVAKKIKVIKDTEFNSMLNKANKLYGEGNVIEAQKLYDDLNRLSGIKQKKTNVVTIKK